MKIIPAKTNVSTLGAFSTDILQPLSIEDRKLISAAAAGDIKGLRAALEAGANVDVKDQRGYTPLMILVDIEYLRGVEFMIKSGADVRVQSAAEGFTALMIAANSAVRIGLGSAIVDALLEADPSDAHVNCVAYSGMTALMIALDAHREKISLKLRDAGAEINILNHGGDSALMFAVKKQDLKTVEFLVKEKFPMSKNQVWEAIGIAAKNNISVCLSLWLAIERNPENFTDSSDQPIIPDEVLRFKSPAAEVAEKDMIFNHQDRSANPAIALSSPFVPAPVRESFNGGDFSEFNDSYFSEYRMGYPPYLALSDEEAGDETPPFAQRQRLVDNSADASYPDNRLVQLSDSVRPSAADEPGTWDLDRPLNGKPDPGSYRLG